MRRLGYAQVQLAWRRNSNPRRFKFWSRQHAGHDLGKDNTHVSRRMIPRAGGDPRRFEHAQVEKMRRIVQHAGPTQIELKYWRMI